jgi:hypothetical protein
MSSKISQRKSKKGRTATKRKSPSPKSPTPKSPSAEKALYDYTVKSDFYINGLLRDGLTFFEKEETRENMTEDGFSDPVVLINKTIQQIHEIDRSFTKKSKEGMVLYRGTKTLRPTPYLGKNTGYISTSKTTNYFKTDAGERFISLKNKCCLYVYELAEGIPYIDLQNISHFKDQEEVLLPRGLTATLMEETKTSIGKTSVKTYRVRLDGPHEDEPYTLHERIVDEASKDFFKNVQLNQLNNLYDKYSDKTDMIIEDMDTEYSGGLTYIVSQESYKKLCMEFLKDMQSLLKTIPVSVSNKYESQINEMLEKGEPITPENFLKIE